ncbi:MAG: 16S rRNA (cytidine(1402)-2'-O)-methyltransferase [Synergistaceae bacterium]|nr:16S rRNA (cytidine(1402)-2'-O)-methyltransferase [Synergistaceae bacterium]
MPLTLVPTPIGNLEDITLRALRVLREADIIACEDTRTSAILLRHYEIQKPLTSFHLHNENDKLPSLIAKLHEGAKIAVISDAGTPGISDPGWILLRRAMDEGIDVDVLPGPNALIPAVLLSGLKPQPFSFIGFPPEKHGERVRLFESLKNFPMTLCFYVSPHKAVKDISDMLEVFGDRPAALVREISKVYQESFNAVLSEITERLKQGVKGELVLVVSGCEEGINDGWKSEAAAMLEDGMSMKDIAVKIEEKHKISRNVIKKYLLESQNT